MLRWTLLLMLLLISFRAEAGGAKGVLEICKHGDPKQYPKDLRAWWNGDVYVPDGMIFKDVGILGNPSSAMASYKIRVITLEEARLVGAKCARVRAVVGGPELGGWGTVHVGQVLETLGPEENRRFEPSGLLDKKAPQPRKLGPWTNDPAVFGKVLEGFY